MTDPKPGDAERVAAIRHYIEHGDHGVTQPDTAFLLRLVDEGDATIAAQASEIADLREQLDDALIDSASAAVEADQHIAGLREQVARLDAKVRFYEVQYQDEVGINGLREQQASLIDRATKAEEEVERLRVALQKIETADTTITGSDDDDNGPVTWRGIPAVIARDALASPQPDAKPDTGLCRYCQSICMPGDRCRKCGDYDAERLKRALSAHPSAVAPQPSGDGWQPIETAPKDGTYILGNKKFWDAGWSPRVMRWEKESWRTDPGNLHQEPTMWCPLPASPALGQVPLSEDLADDEWRQVAEAGARATIDVLLTKRLVIPIV